MAEAFSLSLHEHFARKENHSMESLYQGFDVKIEYLHWTFCSWYDCDLVKGWVSALVTRIWTSTSTSSSREGVVQPSPAQQLTDGWSQALAAAATSPMPPTSICTQLCSLYLTIAAFCSLCLPATEFPYQELTPKCLGHGKKFAWKPSNDITIIEHIVQI